MMPPLIPGPKQPKNDIIVYMQPLRMVDELKDLLIDGLETYNTSRMKLFVYMQH